MNANYIADAFDHDLMLSCLSNIHNGKATKIPKYDFKTNAREEESQIVPPADVILLEGILIFYHPDVRELFDMKLFVDTDADTRLARRGACLAILTCMPTWSAAARSIRMNYREIFHSFQSYATLRIAGVTWNTSSSSTPLWSSLPLRSSVFQ